MLAEPWAFLERKIAARSVDGRSFDETRFLPGFARQTWHGHRPSQILLAPSLQDEKRPRPRP
jgi:hypothetical protein